MFLGGSEVLSLVFPGPGSLSASDTSHHGRSESIYKVPIQFNFKLLNLKFIISHIKCICVFISMHIFIWIIHL